MSTIVGTAGNDSLTGGDGDDILIGGAGDDSLDGGAGSDSISGGDGNDFIYLRHFNGIGVAYGSDSVDGGAGVDSLQLWSQFSEGGVVADLAAGTVRGTNEDGSGSATVANIEDVSGTVFGDRIAGDDAGNQLVGDGGNDTLEGAAGDDTLDGGDGNDWIAGGAGNDSIIGGHGVDTLMGGDGADTLDGGRSSDTFWGGDGADRFLLSWSSLVANVKQIGDFASGSDKIQVDNSAMPNLGAEGNLAAGDARFYAAAGASSAHDADDRIIYNSSTGDLYYDADGSGAAAPAQLIASLQGRPGLVATDIVIGDGEPGGASRHPYRTVLDNGASSNRVDIVIAGDGYTADQIATDYAAHVDSLIAYMFDDSLLTQPFGRYESFFNIHVIDLVSQPDRGALGAAYVQDTWQVEPITAQHVLQEALGGTGIFSDFNWAAIDTDQPSGGSWDGAWATFSARGGSANEIALHEAGHGLGGLADEYWSPGTTWNAGEPFLPNVTADPSAAKWSHWLGYDQPGIGVIGAYEGGMYNESGIYRPSESSKMRSLGKPFDAVGREALILEFYELVDPLDAYLSNAQPLYDTDELWVDTIDPGVLRVDWTINGTTYADAGERISLSALGYSGGAFDVSARAYDPTDWVRIQDRSSLEQTVRWDVFNSSGASPGADSLTGTDGSDTLDGGGGNDFIFGGQGDDLLLGGDGSDHFLMTYGADYGRDTIAGGAGMDVISLGDAASGVQADLGAGSMTGGGPGGSGSASISGIEMFVGGIWADHIVGSASGDYLHGRDGDDTISGGGGHDTIYGAAGRDRFVYAEAPDSASSDQIGDFASGQDRIVLDNSTHANLGNRGDFSAGDARFWAAAGASSGHDADDRVIYDTSNGNLYYDADGSGAAAARLIATLQGAPALSAADFAVVGSNHVLGTSGNDSLTGTEGDDTLEGGGGNDTLFGAGGDDSLRGGDGNDYFLMTYGADYGHDTIVGGAGMDMISIGDAQSGVDADIGAGTMAGGGADGAGSAGFSGIEMFVGGVFADRIAGGSAADYLHGRDGDDTILGRAGHDTIYGAAGDDELAGGLGQDMLEGGTGRDRFVYAEAPGSANADVITDFASGSDQLRFDGAVFTRIGVGGDFSAGDARFHAAAGATGGHDADDRLVYDTSTGNLYYDADGDGAGSAQLVARLQGAPVIAATDIAVDNGGSALSGGSGDDSLLGTATGDTISGQGGNDTIDGSSGDDSLDGGTGSDYLIGRDGADVMLGDDGNDTLDGGTGSDDHRGEPTYSSEDSQPLPGDTMAGGLGNDVYFVQWNDVISDSGGIDTVYTDEWEYTLGAGFENLSLTAFGFSDGEGLVIRYSGNELDNVITSGGWINSSDTLDGGAGNDTLYGGDGTTTFRFSLGNGDYGRDHLEASGEGIIDFADARSAIVADLIAGTLTGGGTGGSGSATLVGVTVVTGGAFDDVIIGSGWFRFGPGISYGGAGNDTMESGGLSSTELSGEDGNDRLVARGDDRLDGGAGADAFVFARDPLDTYTWSFVSDFASGTDKIVLDGRFHSGIGASGNFAAGDARFAANASGTATDANHRVVYNTATGELWYDEDGSGAGASKLITVLQQGSAVAATDFAVENGSAPPGGQTITGTAGNDSLTGGPGNDTLDGLGGADTMNGQLGDDTYHVTAGDVLQDSGGIDTVLTPISWNISTTTIDNVTVTGTAAVQIDGNALANVIIGNEAANNINARAGNDTISGNGGNDLFLMSMGGTTSFGTDWIDGGAGIDTVDFGANPQSALVADLAAGTVSGGEAGGGGFSTILNMEKFIAGNFADRVSGNAAANNFWGGLGNDTLIGLAGGDSLSGADGNDWLEGGTGFDTLVGGAGADSFVFNSTAGSANADRINDFALGTDQLLFENDVLTALGAPGDWAAGDGRFRAAAGATSGADANDRLIYNTSNGNLYYDPDGVGGTAGQILVTLSGAPALTAADITVI